MMFGIFSRLRLIPNVWGLEYFIFNYKQGIIYESTNFYKKVGARKRAVVN